MTSKPPAVSPAEAKPRKSIKVQFWYDDGTTEWVEGKEYEKWQQGVNGAIQNDYIHGAWSQLILTSIKWKKASTTDRVTALAAKLKRECGSQEGCFGGNDTYIIKHSTLREVISALEASRPAQDIVAEMLEKVERLKKRHGRDDYGWEVEQKELYNRAISDVLAILSPTKNTAPTEAEEL